MPSIPATTVFAGGLPATGDTDDATADWEGEGTEDSAGSGLLGGVDFTGDAVPDLVIGAFRNGSNGGAAYLLSGEGAVLDGGSLSGADVRFYSTDDGSSTGFGSAAIDAGDVNGDGVEDLGIGWRSYVAGAQGTVGAVAMFLGPISGHYLATDADSLVTGYDFRIGTQNPSAGVGDVDGDGLDDMVLGSPEANTGGDSQPGIAYLMSGTDVASGRDTRFALATFSGTSQSQNLGAATSRVGDVDGDGNVDVVITGSGDDAYAGMGGAGYIWYGPLSGSLTAADAGAAWYGSSDPGAMGLNMVAGHDLTGDAYADLVFGAPNGEGDSAYSGVVYVVPGLAP